MKYVQLHQSRVVSTSLAALFNCGYDQIEVPEEMIVEVGSIWDGATFSTVPVATETTTEWLIDIGPFYDRFGAAKMAVLTSADPMVKAIVADISIRKWIDLERADVSSALAYIRSVVPSVTESLATAILTSPVTAEENLALRKVYFT